tara:strand:- start:177 stop:497 length:321 start_codon:yes stop_codon:yes gene_type:complete
MKLTETRIKQIIKEEIDAMDEAIEPMTLVAGGVGLYALYKFIFGREPNTEEDLNRVREYVNQLQAKADAGDDIYKNMPRPPEPPGEEQRKARARQRLMRLKQDRGM